MNKIFKVIWSKARNCYIVVSELAKNHDTGHTSRIRGGLLAASLMLSLSCPMYGFAADMPNTYTTDGVTYTLSSSSGDWTGTYYNSDKREYLVVTYQNDGQYNRDAATITSMPKTYKNGKDTYTLGNFADWTGNYYDEGSNKCATVTYQGNEYNPKKASVILTVDKSGAVDEKGNVVYGEGNTANGHGNVIYGKSNSADAGTSSDPGQAVVIGVHNKANGIAKNSTIIGQFDIVNSPNTVAIGNNIQENGSPKGGTVIIGNYAHSDSSAGGFYDTNKKYIPAGIILGEYSFSRPSANTKEAYLKPSVVSDSNKDYWNATWTPTANPVSIGDVVPNSGDDNASGGNGHGIITRQINGVAAGSYDTDAVNVAQLKQAIAKWNQGGGGTGGSSIHFYHVNSTDSSKGNYNNDGAKGTDALAAGVDARAIGDRSTAVGNGAKAGTQIEGTNQVTGANSTAVGNGAQALADSAVAIGDGAVADGVGATVIGKHAQATGKYATAFGGFDTYVNTASGNSSTAFGQGAQARGVASLAFGHNTIAGEEGGGGQQSVAFGEDTQALGGRSLAFGEKTVAKYNDSVAFGNDTRASSTGATAFGNRTRALAQYSTAWGNATVAADEESTAWGTDTIAGAKLDDNGAVTNIYTYKNNPDDKDESLKTATEQMDVHGNLAYIQPKGKTAGIKQMKIDSGDELHDYVVLAGKDGNTYVRDYQGSLWKVNVAADGTVTVDTAAGKNGKVYNGKNGAKESLATTTVKDAEVAITPDNVLTKAHEGTNGYNIDGYKDATAFGYSTEASGDYATAFGNDTQAKATGATAFGNKSQATGRYATAWGGSKVVQNEDGTISEIGTGTVASGDNATSFGYSTEASGKQATAFGSSSTASGDNATAFGENSTASGEASTAFGIGSQAAGKNSLAALGGTVAADATNSAAIGNGAQATLADTVALGSNSKTTRAKYKALTPGSAEANAYGKTSKDTRVAAWEATENAIAVGNDSNDSTATRQVTGVAAGSLDTDAVNVAQLKRLNENLSGQHTIVTVGNQSVSADNTPVTGGNLDLTRKTATNGQATYDLSLDRHVTLGEQAKDKGGSLTVNNVAYKSYDTDGNPLPDSVFGEAVKIDGKTVSVVKQDGESDQRQVVLGIDQDAGGYVALYDNTEKKPTYIFNAISSGITYLDGNNKFGRLEYGDIYNGSTQFIATLDDGLKFKGDDDKVITKKLNEQLDIVGGAQGDLTDKNIAVKSTEDGKLKVQMAKNLTDLTSVTTGNTTIDNGGLTITKKDGNKTTTVSLTDSGLDNGGNTITNVAAGTNGKDAVNVSQLNASRTTVQSSDNSISVTDSTNGKPNHAYDIKVATSTLSNETDGKVTITNPNNNTNSYATGTSVANAINNAGFTLTTSSSDGGSVSGTTTPLIKPGSTVTLDAGKNIALTQDGSKITVATKDDLDVNSVTYTTKEDNKTYTTFINGKGITITPPGVEEDKDKIILNENGLSNGGNKITNVAAGSADYDAVNMSQLNAFKTHYYSVDDTLLPVTIDGKDYSNKDNDGAKGMGSLAAGFNTYTGGIASTVAGSYSGVLNSGDVKLLGYDLRGATALSYGTLNVNKNDEKSSKFSGVANSIIGQANATTNSNAAIIYGAGNTIKNSYRDIDLTKFNLTKIISDLSNPEELAKDLRDAVPTSGGQVMVLGGGNSVDNAYMTQVNGVGNTVTGKSDEGKTYNPADSTQFNYIEGFYTNLTNGKNDYIIGAHNNVTGKSVADNQSNIVFGDNHTLTNTKNNVILGSADATDKAKTDTTTVSDVVSIGHNAKVSAEGGVAIGSGSVVSKDNGAGAIGYDPLGTEHKDDTTGVWKSTDGAVSVGKAEVKDGNGNVTNKATTRQLTNLAAGTLDTDAVNVAQLKLLKSSIVHTAVTVNDKGNATTATAGDNVYGEYAGSATGNLLIAAKKDTRSGQMTYNIKLNDQLTIGKDGVDGVDGKVGIAGKDGNDAVAISGKDGVGHIGLTGPKGENGADGTFVDIHTDYGVKTLDTNKNIMVNDVEKASRLIYTDSKGDHEVATMDDGLKFVGDDGTAAPVAKKLNETLQIRGDGTYDAATKTSNGNIKTSIDQDTIKVELNKDINLHQDGSLTVGGSSESGSTTVTDPIVIKHFNAGQLTVTGTDKDGQTPQSTAGDYITGLDNTNWDVKNPTYVSGRAATEDQLKKISDAVNDADTKAGKHTVVTVNDKANATEATAGKGDYGAYSSTDKGNLLIAAKDNDGQMTYNIKLNDQLAIGKDGKDGKVTVETRGGTTVVIGHDGKDGEDGKDGLFVTGKDGQDGKSGVSIIGPNGQSGADGIDGKVGIAGKDGKDAVSISGKDGVGHIGLTGPKGENGTSIDIHTDYGVKTLDAQKNVTINGEEKASRIIYTDAKGDHEVATMDDGLKYASDFGNAAVKLNKTVTIKGTVKEGAKETDFVDGNIAVVANKKGEDGELLIKLNKDLTGLNSATYTTSTKNGDVTTKSKTVVDGTGLKIENGPSITNTGIDGGSHQITNVASGKDGNMYDTMVKGQENWNNAANIGDVTNIAKTAADSVQAKSGKNITVHHDNTVNLNDNITLGDDKTKQVSINGNDAKITAGDGSNKVTVDGSQGQIVAGGDDGVKIGKIADGDRSLTIYDKDGNKTDKKADGGKYVTNLDNKTWNTDGSYVSGRAATEDQLHQVESNVNQKFTEVNNQIKNVDKRHTEVTVNGGTAAKNDGSYTDGNLQIAQTGTDGQKIYDLKLSDNLNIGGKDGQNGKMGIKGADGKDGVTIKGGDGENGTDGHIGINGKDGTSADIHVKNGQNGVDGTDGRGGKDGMDRVVYEDHNHVTHEVATMDDGLKFVGDDNKSIAKKLNETLSITGGQTDSSKLSTGANVGVVNDNGGLKIELAKDITGVNSMTFNSTTDNSKHVTISGDKVDVGGNKIENVAPGKVTPDSTDAVNGSQLWQRDQAINGLSGSVNKLGNRINRVGAGAAALAALHPLDFDPDDKWDFAAGYGNYRGANAAAVGAYYRPNEDTMFSIGGSFGGGENMVNAGVSFKLGQGNHVSTSRVAMAKEIKDLRQDVANLNAIVNRQSALIDKLTGTNAGTVSDTGNDLFPDVPANHWAYEYVSKLKQAGILTGYPDGNFDGDRMMTRYEFAAIVYRAIMAGAASNPALNQDGTLNKLAKEFSPEMKYIRIDTIAKDKNDKPTIERVRVIPDAK